MTRLLIAFALLLAACAQVEPDESVRLDGPLPDASLYHLDATWTTQDDETVTLADFRGEPVVISLIYARCASACAVLALDMRKIEAELGRPGVRYVLVSLDPEHDTPERLRSLKAGYRLSDDFTLLRGDPRDVRRLAALLGVQYRTEPNGEISHSNLITVLDRHGEPVRRQEGLSVPPAESATALRSLLASR